VVAQNLAFWVLAIVMAAASIGVVRTRNVVHAALFLVVVLAGAAAQFILIGAEFVAWVQVLIYIGAVIILFLFGIMLTRAPMRAQSDLDNDQRWPAAIVAAGLLAVLVVLLLDAFGDDEIRIAGDLLDVGRAGPVGDSIFRSFVIPFEVVSMLLLAALVGAVAIARRD
jgi:NADH-quinone oxidoreductase subunit J